MQKLALLALGAALFWSSQVFALGVDIGPVHVHGTNVKVGDSTTLSVTVDSITRDENDKSRVVRIEGHHKGDKGDKMTIIPTRGDLDDDSKDMLKRIKEDNTYSMKLERMDDGWKLTKIRPDDE